MNYFLFKILDAHRDEETRENYAPVNRYILSHLAQYQYSLVRHTAVGPVNVATLYSVTHLVQRMLVLTLFKEQAIILRISD